MIFPREMNLSTFLNYFSFVTLFLVLAISVWMILRWCISFEKRIQRLEEGRVTGLKKYDLVETV